MSAFVAYVLGVVSAIIATVVGRRVTDSLRDRKAERGRVAEFARVASRMPKLIGDMKSALLEADNATTRHFFVLPDRGVTLAWDQRAMCYYADEHDDLHGRVAMLEGAGYVVNVTSGTAPKYRMTESFVQLVTEHR